MQEMRVQTLGWEDSLATHSSILAWEIPWTEKPGRLQSTGLPRVRYDLATKHTQRTGTKVRQVRQPGLRVKEAFIFRVGVLTCFTLVPALAAQQMTPKLVASLVAQMAKSLPTMQETRSGPWVGKIPWRRA